MLFCAAMTSVPDCSSTRSCILNNTDVLFSWAWHRLLKSHSLNSMNESIITCAIVRPRNVSQRLSIITLVKKSLVKSCILTDLHFRMILHLFIRYSFIHWNARNMQMFSLPIIFKYIFQNIHWIKSSYPWNFKWSVSKLWCQPSVL